MVMATPANNAATRGELMRSKPTKSAIRRIGRKRGPCEENTDLNGAYPERIELADNP
ncbi:unannotated protein [freshwater metagenome]|uniref:Unannotated protein n=1 Tax=freshwater metagenome TaxID=449393 RepID=A0A6J7EB07_9ZZZZ